MSKQHTDQSLAFPSFLPGKTPADDDIFFTGMTMRDYFAGQALIAILMASRMRGEERTEPSIAEEAYVVVQAMMGERRDPSPR